MALVLQVFSEHIQQLQSWLRFLPQSVHALSHKNNLKLTCQSVSSSSPFLLREPHTHKKNILGDDQIAARNTKFYEVYIVENRVRPQIEEKILELHPYPINLKTLCLDPLLAYGFIIGRYWMLNSSFDKMKGNLNLKPKSYNRGQIGTVSFIQQLQNMLRWINIILNIHIKTRS